MKRRDLLAKSAIAAAGLFSLPLIAQDDLSLQIWEDTDRILRNDLLRQAFPHIYHHRKCGHILFHSDRVFKNGEELWPEHILLPDGQHPYLGQPYHCNSCDEPFYPSDEELFHREEQ